MLSTFGRLDAFRRYNTRGYGFTSDDIESTAASDATAVTTSSAASGMTPAKSIMLGVITGLTVWAVTRTLDRYLEKKR